MTDQTTNQSSLSAPQSTTTNSLQAVCILGATGAIGSHLLHHLLNNTTNVSQVYSFVRRTGTFDNHIHKDRLIEIPIGEDLQTAMEVNWPNDVQITTVFSCLGSTAKQAGSSEQFVAIDYGMNDIFFTFAKSKGIQQSHLISSVGADATSGNLYLQTKGRLENRLKELQFQHTFIYRPGILDNASRPTQPSRCGEACGLFCMKYLCCCFLSNCFSAWRPIDVNYIGYVLNKLFVQTSNAATTTTTTQQQSVENQNTYQLDDNQGCQIFNGSQQILNLYHQFVKQEEQSVN